MNFPPASRTVVFRLQGSAVRACAIGLSVVALQGVAETRSEAPSAKAREVTATSERSIHRTLTEESVDQAGLLLDMGASIDARNAQGATPLMTASGRGNPTLVHLLIKRGARIDAADHNGNTALHEASFQADARCVEALLVAGAQPSVRNALGSTPLHQAVRRFWEKPGESSQDRLAKQTVVIGLLLRYGADPSLPDGSGRTPAVFAVQSTNGSLQQALNVPPPRLAPLQARPSLSPENKPIPPDSAVPSSTDRRPSPADTAITPPPTRQNEQLSALPLPAVPAEKPVKANPSAATPPPLSLPSPSPLTPSAPGIGKEAPPAVPDPTSKGEAGQDSSSSQPPPADGRPISGPSEVASPQPSREAQAGAGTGETSTTPNTPVATAPDAQVPTSPEPVVIPSISDVARRPNRHSAGLSHESNPAPSSAGAGSPPALTSPQLLSAEEPTKPVTETAPRAGRSTTPLDRTGEFRTAEHRSPWFQNVGFGLGLGWTHNLGPRRVDSVTVVNGVVRIDNEQNDLVRFMPEMHIWLDRWDEQRWGWGPFLAVAPGSRVIDAIGFGLMIGYRPHQTDQYSFNLGIGGTLDLYTTVLGDGLVANEPLPPGETSARTKQTTAAGLLIMLSVGWDLAAPHRSSESDGQ